LKDYDRRISQEDLRGIQREASEARDDIGKVRSDLDTLRHEIEGFEM
jgi:hypothetical protein